MKKYLCEAVVPISPQMYILKLKQLLVEMEPTIFADVNIDMVEVWKCTTLKISDNEGFEEHLRRFDFSDNQTARMLRPSIKVSSLDVTTFFYTGGLTVQTVPLDPYSS